MKNAIILIVIVAVLIAGYLLLFKKKDPETKQTEYIKINNAPVIPSDNPYKGYYGSV